MIDESLRAPDAERMVLAAAMREPAAADAALCEVGPEHFANQVTRAAWTAIQDLRREGRPTDADSVADQMRRSGTQVDVQRLQKVESETPLEPEKARERAMVVREAAARRAMRDAAVAMLAAANDTARPLVELQDASRAAVLAASDSLTTDHTITMSAAMLEARSYIEAIQERRAAPGLGTSIKLLDTYTRGGPQPGEMWALGGMAASGKSGLAEQMAIHGSMNLGERVHFASAEMTARDLAVRAMSLFKLVDGTRAYIPGALTAEERACLGHYIDQVVTKLGDRLTIDDASMTMEGICATVRRIHARTPLRLVVIDHLHHLQLPDAERQDLAVGQAAAQAKALAKTLHISVLLLAQLNRAYVHRGGDTADLTDFRDSQAIGEQASVAMILRPSTTAPEEPTAVTRDMSLHVVKNRNGRIGRLPLRLELSRVRFAERTDVEAPASGGT